MTEFSKGELKPDGSFSVTHVRSIKQASMLKCPHCIMMPEHYCADESCRCNDPDHTEMTDWGYVWDGSLWVSNEEEDE